MEFWPQVPKHEPKFQGQEGSRDQETRLGSSLKTHSGWDRFTKLVWDEQGGWGQ